MCYEEFLFLVSFQHPFPVISSDVLEYYAKTFTPLIKTGVWIQRIVSSFIKTFYQASW